jgi:hypothetical protein
MAERRRIVLIDRKFQFRQIGGFAGLTAAVMVLFGGLVWMFLRSEIDANLSSAHVSFRTFRDMLLPIVLSLSALNILLAAAFAAIFVLYTSHKIAGPLFRFKAVLDEMSGRNLVPATRIRDDDQLHDVCESLERLAEVSKSDWREIRKMAAEARAAAAAGESGTVAGLLAEIEALSAQYRV